LGAGVTAVLFTIGKAVIGYYIGQASVGSAYGAATEHTSVAVTMPDAHPTLLLRLSLVRCFPQGISSGILRTRLLEHPTGHQTGHQTTAEGQKAQTHAFAHRGLQFTTEQGVGVVKVGSYE
jgi:hypothetical protein